MDRQFVVILLSIPYYFLLKESIFCVCRFACVSVDHMLAWCPQQSEGTGFPETGSYRQSWAVMWMLGTKPGSPGRTAGALDLWATSSAPLTLLFNLLLKHTHTHHTQARVHTHTASALVEERLLKSSPYGLWVTHLQMIRRRFRKHL